MAGFSRTFEALRSPAPATPFERLVPFSWRGELLVICGGMLASFLIAGFWYPYWRIADMDLWMVYNALLLNDRLPQEFFDHPGYLTILSLAEWLRLLHGVGLVKTMALSALPTDAAGFARAWAAATQAGRVLSLLYAAGFVLSFAYLMRAWLRDWRIAAVAAFMLAFSGGMAMEMRIMRTELLPAWFFTAALLLLLIAAKRGPQWWRPLAAGIAALLCALAMENKIQFLFVIVALPVLLAPFGPEEPASDFWHASGRRWPALVLSAIAAAIAFYLAKDIVVAGLSGNSSPGLRLAALPLGANIYWPAFIAWVALGMAGYACYWRVNALETVTAAFAIVAGCMLGLLVLDIRFQTADAVVIFHPLEQMYAWAAGAQTQLAHGGFVDRLAFLIEAIGGVIARRTFVLQSSSRPTIFLEWFVIAATVIAIRRHEWKLTAQAGALMLTVWGVDTLSMGRGLKQEYFILTDPLAIVAAALLIAKLADLQRHRWCYPIGATLIVAHIVVSQAEPVKHVFKSGGEDTICEFHGYTPRLQPPVCASPR